MKSVRKVALTALLTVSAFSAVTFTSCKKSDDSCAVGYTGSNCKDEVRATYYGDYKGNGSDNSGGTYSNFLLTFGQSTTDATKMTLIVKDATTAPIAAFTVTLTSNTTFTIDPVTIGSDAYTGNGTITATSASATITDKDATSTTVITFNNMIRQ